MTLLVDASVWVAAIDTDDPGSTASYELIRRAEIDRATIDLACLEVTNALSRRCSASTAKATLQLMRWSTRGRTVSLSESELDHLGEVVSRTGLSAYDGAYVVVAASRRWQLVSLDRRDLVEPGWAITPERALSRI